MRLQRSVSMRCPVERRRWPSWGFLIARKGDRCAALAERLVNPGPSSGTIVPGAGPRLRRKSGPAAADGARRFQPPFNPQPGWGGGLIYGNSVLALCAPSR